MAMININSATKDMFYRYKMPKLVAKVEGTGNGIKTVLVNVSAIAKALHRPPTYVTKFFGCELGAQVQMNAKEDRYIVNGAHESEKLQNLLDGFIKRFVLCPNCDNPETRLSFRKRNGGEIHQLCTACGNQGSINMASHKLTTYISKNPPDGDGKNEATAQPEPKGKGRSKKDKKAQGNNAGGDSNEDSPPETGGKSNGASKNGAGGDQDDDEDWGDDLLPTVAKLDLQIKGMIQTDDLEKPLADRLDKFNHLLHEKKDQNQLNDVETVKELITEAEHLEIMEKAPFVVAKELFTENVVKEIDTYKMLLIKLCMKNAKGQKYLLHGLESVMGDNAEIRSKLINTKSMSRILLKLYESNIVEEDVFYAWHEKASKRYTDKATAKDIREKANEFIDWLKTAEESSDEEDDDESRRTPEPQIDFTPMAINGLEVKVEPVKKEPVDEKIEYGGEVIDVDNI